MFVMYRWPAILLFLALLSGCAQLKGSEFFARTGEALSRIGESTPSRDLSAQDLSAEVDALFEQPYIDPLTEYLHQHANDASRETQLQRVEIERERRCDVVARRYNSDEISKTNLALYRRGYSFSCPEDVAAYAARLESMGARPAPPQPTRNTPAVEEPKVKSNDVLADESDGKDLPAQETMVESDSVDPAQLNECYLLTRIRNFSGALKACLGPADAGVTGAQVSMARIQSALGQHEAAFGWATKAAPESGQAAYLLGTMYADGLGTAQDIEAARKWFRTATELGHREAAFALERLRTENRDGNGG